MAPPGGFFKQFQCSGVVFGGKTLDIFENLQQDAFTVAYEERASCRRFVSREAAQRYRDMLEEMAEKFQEEHTNAYRVIQVYDTELQKELLSYMNALEYQAKRYRRNLGYKD